jgi:hypothetical protein
MCGCRCVKVDAEGPRGHSDDTLADQWFFPDDIPDFRDPATLGILRAQVVALVPGAVDVSVMRGWSATMPQPIKTMWIDHLGFHARRASLAVAWNDHWPIEALVAVLEAAKAGTLT